MATALLEPILQEAKAQLQRRKAGESTILLKEITPLALSRGFDLPVLLQRAQDLRRNAPKLAPKYRNPDNPSQLWAGRGKQPLWFKHGLESGKTVQDFLIHQD